MIRYRLFTWTLVLSVASAVWGASLAAAADYPAARRAASGDDFFGTRVADPYRWLENVDDPEVQAWVDKQNALTRSHIDKLPQREYLVQRMTELLNYPRYGVPEEKGPWVFFWKNDGLQNQSVLYKQKGLQGKPGVLLDPNALNADGTISVGAEGLTLDGALFAYGLKQSGSDWETIHIMDVSSGRAFPDTLERCRFTNIAWAPDNSGIYYSRYSEDEELYQKLYFHRLGEPQSQDVLVYERPENKELGINGVVTDDGRFLVIHVWKGTATENEIYIKRLDQQATPIEPLFTGFENSFGFIESVGSRLYFETDKDAPRHRVVYLDYGATKLLLHEVVPQDRDVIRLVRVANGQLVVAYLHNAYDRLRVYSLDGELQHNIAMPTLGTISSLSGSPQHKDLFVGLSSFLFPSQNYSVDFKSGKLALYQKSELDFDPDGFTARQVFYESKDGTKIPMFLVHRRGIRLDSDNPVLLYAYGGFNNSMTPTFSTSRLAWLEQGGIFAMPNLRGGGEFGEEWHRAGMLEKKQNVFDDFIAAAEWLIAQGYSSPERIAIEGGSNGGLLTAVCAVQRPDLYGCVLSRVPVIDMLRYHRFTIGSYWKPEYGDPENAEHFAFLYKYSPLHNLQKGTRYPAMLITTADTDTRVDAAHGKKFAAAIQTATRGDNPILLRVETKAGHGAGKPLTKRIEESADLYSFTMDRLGMQVTRHGVVVETTPR